MKNALNKSRKDADIAKITKAFHVARNHSSAWAMSLLLASATASSASERSLPPSINGASGDALGGGVDFDQKITALDEQIAHIETQIHGIEEKGVDKLSREEIESLFALQDSLRNLQDNKQSLQSAHVEFENGIQSTQAEAIKNKRDDIRENFEKIKEAIQR